jgi:hypothetical protein
VTNINYCGKTVCVSVSITVQKLIGPTTCCVTAEYLSMEFTKSAMLILQHTMVLGYNMKNSTVAKGGYEPESSYLFDIYMSKAGVYSCDLVSRTVP